MKLLHPFLVGLILFIFSFQLGCNTFEFMDSPGDDAQYLSAARACLDGGDIQCAIDNYQKLSNDQADIKASELVFVTMESAGLGMSAIME